MAGKNEKWISVMIGSGMMVIFGILSIVSSIEKKMVQTKPDFVPENATRSM